MFKKYIEARNKALENDDLEWVAAQLPKNTRPHIVELAFHKARLECRDISKGKRLASKAFLIAGGHNDILGKPINPDDELPW